MKRILCYGIANAENYVLSANPKWRTADNPDMLRSFETLRANVAQQIAAGRREPGPRNDWRIVPVDITAAGVAVRKIKTVPGGIALTYIETREFEFAHGRKPRGYGCWIFDVDYPPAGTGGRGRVIRVQHTGTYGDVKRAVMREHPGTVIKLCS